ncbi:MAG: GspE/PulE family protein [Steroidobacteraceae bacterium]
MAQQRGLDELIVGAAIAEARRSGEPVLDVLQRSSGLDSHDLGTALAAMFQYEFIGGDKLGELTPNFTQLSPAESARRLCVVVDGNTMLRAVFCNPFDDKLRPWLEARIDAPLEWVLAGRGELSAYIGRHGRSVRAVDSAAKDISGALQRDKQIKLDDLSLVSISQDASPIVKLVHSTLYDALRSGASDIHIETTAAGLVIRYRLDGVLMSATEVSGADVAEQVISRIKVMSELDIAERRIPQDGRFKIAIDSRPIDFRVSIIPSIFGEDAVVRILDKQAITNRMQGLRLDGLGFEPRIVHELRVLAARPHGMLLVTGPTGSGKTTTLYAAISETNNGQDKIVTIEDPVEYQLAGVLQIPVNEKKGLTFARGLRSILRHDPDKIMVGEIRDTETAQIAIQSALTGHLVFTTVHANNVFDVLSRFVHMNVDAHSFVAALNGILAQRLIRVICEQCSEAVPPARHLIDQSGISGVAAASFAFRRGRGCRHCRGSGYRGRVAIGELLVLNDELREAIVSRVPVRQLKEMAVRAGVRLIRRSAVELVRRGITTLEEANRVTSMA